MNFYGLHVNHFQYLSAEERHPIVIEDSEEDEMYLEYFDDDMWTEDGEQYCNAVSDEVLGIHSYNKDSQASRRTADQSSQPQFKHQPQVLSGTKGLKEYRPVEQPHIDQIDHSKPYHNTPMEEIRDTLCQKIDQSQDNFKG